MTDGRYRGRPVQAAGTHRQPLEGLPATNRFVVVHCVFYCELELERLHRVRAFFDLYDAATQLGVLPARGTIGEKALLDAARVRSAERPRVASRGRRWGGRVRHWCILGARAQTLAGRAAQTRYLTWGLHRVGNESRLTGGLR